MLEEEKWLEDDLVQEDMTNQEDNSKSQKKKKVKTIKEEKVERVRLPRNKLVQISKPVGFRAWFIGTMSKDKRIKDYKYDEILSFFKGCGLTEIEPSHKYDKILRSYFGE